MYNTGRKNQEGSIGGKTVLRDGKIQIGSCGTGPVFLRPEMANRHGLIAGATGTGKTVTLKVLAEGFSEMGVPVFLSDIKSDLSGMVKPGTRSEAIEKRLRKCGVDPDTFAFKDFPSRFWDVYGRMGRPIQATVRGMGAQLLGRMLGLNETQTGVLGILFRYCEQYGYALNTLDQLKEKLIFMGEHAREFTLHYGNVSATTIGAIQRAVATLEEEGGRAFFGESEFDVLQWLMRDEQDRGVINMLSADELFTHPLMYSTFLMWMLTRLYEKLPERGDLDKPVAVFFFDEAHLLFDNCSRTLMDKIEQVVRLIRSKGVGVYFITQSPADIPMTVLGQLGNRVQHALRAYTPLDQKAVRVAAQTFRTNPDFDTEDAITSMKTGEALVSCLDADGAPGIVQKTVILPPQSHLGALNPEERAWVASGNELKDLYPEEAPAEAGSEPDEMKEPLTEAPAEADLPDVPPAEAAAETEPPAEAVSPETKAEPADQPAGGPVPVMDFPPEPAERPAAAAAPVPQIAFSAEMPEAAAEIPVIQVVPQELSENQALAAQLAAALGQAGEPPAWPETANPFEPAKPVSSASIPELDIPAVYSQPADIQSIPTLELPVSPTTPEPVQEITGEKRMSMTFKVYDPITGQYVEQEKPDMTPIPQAAPAAPAPQEAPEQAVPTIQVQPAAQPPVYQQPAVQQPAAMPVFQQMPVMMQDPATGQYVQQMMLMQQDPNTGNWIPVQPMPMTQQAPVVPQAQAAPQTMDPIALAEQQKAAAAARQEAEKAALQAQKDAEKAAKEAAKAAREQEAAERRARNDALREEAAERARKNDSVAGRIANTAISTATRQVTSTLTKGITNAISDLFGGKKK